MRIVLTTSSPGSVSCKVDDRQLPCEVALFANATFDVIGPLIFFNDGLCNKMDYLHISMSYVEGIIAAVERGNCTFEMKSTVAETLGFKALVVINNNSTYFPMGTNTNYRSTIPMVMIGMGAIDVDAYRADFTNVSNWHTIAMKGTSPLSCPSNSHSDIHVL